MSHGDSIFTERHPIEIPCPSIIAARRRVAKAVVLQEAKWPPGNITGFCPRAVTRDLETRPQSLAGGGLAEWFRALGERGLLRVPYPALAAQHFNWLVLSVPLHKAMTCPSTSPCSASPNSTTTPTPPSSWPHTGNPASRRTATVSSKLDAFRHRKASPWASYCES
ncbi:TetR/AcrR family transcriptional regulator C-terminal domain-containing protein [Actinokineospora sp. 24-640]